MDSKTKNFLQWNTQFISTSKEEIVNLINAYKPSVISIQETFLGNEYMLKFGGYNCIFKQGHYNNRYHGGVAIYTHSSLPVEEIKLSCQVYGLRGVS